jgi:hypothetical protein
MEVAPELAPRPKTKDNPNTAIAIATIREIKLNALICGLRSLNLRMAPMVISQVSIFV